VNGFASHLRDRRRRRPGRAPSRRRGSSCILEPRELEREDCWEAGLHDETYPPAFRRPEKPGTTGSNCDALAQRAVRGFDEALLFQRSRRDWSPPVAPNVFLVRDGKNLTRPRASGCRLGVVRDMGIKRRKSKSGRLRREDVVDADEIFLTNSWLGVMPIATLEGRPLGPRSIGPRLGDGFCVVLTTEEPGDLRSSGFGVVVGRFVEARGDAERAEETVGGIGAALGGLRSGIRFFQDEGKGRV
jgi:hypothetical protein